MKHKLSLISLIHAYKLVYRGLLFIWAVLTYIMNPKFHTMDFETGRAHFHLLFNVIWIVFTIEMICRFFPSPTESMGCQKQFGKNFLKDPKSLPRSSCDYRSINRGVPLVLLSWLALNGVIAALYFAGILSDGLIMIIALFYSVCDLICILFFCPFQTWMMKNRCCTTCRIYNWDYLMMFTPLILVLNPYTWSLVILALGLFIRWEITAWRHPERFLEAANASLHCANCREKLCLHKKQLHSFWEYEKKRHRIDFFK